MSTTNEPAAVASVQPKWMTIAGWVITALVVGGLCFSASMKFMQPPELVKEFARLELDVKKLAIALGIVETACALIYLFPRTAVLGAVLITGYIGGAILTHLRINDNFAPPIIIGVLAWLGIFLREPRLRPIMFWR